jgi:hypothetical protein
VSSSRVVTGDPLAGIENAQDQRGGGTLLDHTKNAIF